MSVVYLFSSHFVLVGVSLHVMVSYVRIFPRTITLYSYFTAIRTLIFFSFFLLCLKYIHTAYSHGDLDRLLVPADSKGRKCGVDNSVIDKPYLLFFNLEKCIDPLVPLHGCKTPQVCVQKCPSTSFIYSEFQCNPSKVAEIRSQLICQMHVQMESIQSCNDITERIKNHECASWYLPSNSCMLNFHIILYSFVLRHYFVFIFRLFV